MKKSTRSTLMWTAIILAVLVPLSIYLASITPEPATQAQKDRALIEALER